MPEMKVLVLGLPRTGTQSVADALSILGISPVYHMREVARNKHARHWTSLIESKSAGDELTASSFAPVLEGYEAISDFPAAVFPAELINSYPSAAIILTTRSEESWKRSMVDTLIHAHLNSKTTSKPDDDLARMREAYHRYVWDDDFEKNASRVFNEYHELVRKCASEKGRQVLELPVGSGWGPLCEFLDVPVPDMEYPNEDSWRGYKEAVAMRREGERKAEDRLETQEV